MSDDKILQLAEEMGNYAHEPELATKLAQILEKVDIYDKAIRVASEVDYIVQTLGSDIDMCLSRIKAIEDAAQVQPKP